MVKSLLISSWKVGLLTFEDMLSIDGGITILDSSIGGFASVTLAGALSSTAL